MNNIFNVAVLGSTGYVGMELVELLNNHPNININFLGSETVTNEYLTNISGNCEGNVQLTERFLGTYSDNSTKKTVKFSHDDNISVEATLGELTIQSVMLQFDNLSLLNDTNRMFCGYSYWADIENNVSGCNLTSNTSSSSDSSYSNDESYSSNYSHTNNTNMNEGYPESGDIMKLIMAVLDNDSLSVVINQLTIGSKTRGAIGATWIKDFHTT